MRQLWIRAREGAGAAFVAGLVAGLAAPALAGSFYSWRTEDGVAAYTDDPKRIPSRYRAQARERDLGELRSYERFTPVGTEAAEALARAEAARAAARAKGLPGVSSPPPGLASNGVELRTPHLNIALPPSSDGDPVVVEERKVRDPESNSTYTAQVIRRGDEVIAIIKPFPNQYNPSDLAEGVE